MIGVYYGTDPKRIRRASTRLREALAQLGEWTTESGWLAGPGPTLAEAVMIPIHVRMDGLRRLGFTAPPTSQFEAHGDRCRELAGWAAVAWAEEQTAEYVGRFSRYRERSNHPQ
jgi:glutathione S-transferase